MAWYRFHELAIDSSIELPELVELSTQDLKRGVCQVRSASESETDHAARPPDHPSDVDPVTITTGEGTAMSFQSGVAFFLPATADQVVIRDVADADPATVRHLLLDHVLPRHLAGRGHFVAHASAVDYMGRALVFLGASGHGKSSLAASLHRVGHPLLGDDCFVLQENDNKTVTGMSTYHGIRLLPESITEFYPQLPSGAFSSTGRDRAKVRVHTHDRDEPHSLPVAAIFVLNAGNHFGAPAARDLSQRDAMVELTKNSFRVDPSHGPSLAAALDRAAVIADLVPVQELCYERNFDGLGQVHQAIYESVAPG